jgi:uncharacterized tellurite resistance protein B-like protein
MASGKKGRSGGILAVVVVCTIALLAAVPSGLRVGLGVLLVVGIAGYLLTRAGSPEVLTPSNESAEVASGSTSTSTSTPTPTPTPSPRTATHESVESVAPLEWTPVDEQLTIVRSSAANFGPSYRVPRAPQGYGPASWIPIGQSVVVAGTTISGGLVYVGTSLPSPGGSNDPCLIDPSKSVASSGNYTERQMNYWPSYSDVSPAARRAYLHWLAGGRQDPQADIGFVFLFFYGLERRAIVDASKDEAAQADWPVIADELRRLLGIYGDKSGSFRRYASELLDWVALAQHPSRLYERPVPEFPKTLELPLYVRLALGQAAVDGVPVPVALALAWARLDPNIVLRTPAARCAEEFERVFAQKYGELCGAGMLLPRNRTKLKLVYQPASAGFRGFQELKLTFKDTPDVTVLTAPTRRLQEVVEAATKPLESYSRLVGKNPGARASIDAWLQLPATLWPEAGQKALRGLQGRIGAGMVALSFRDLLASLGGTGPFTRDKTVSLARALESVGIGFEPDVLTGAKVPKPEDKVVLFALPLSEPITRVGGPYLAAALTLQLASAVASADGEFGIKEMGHLRETVLTWKHLPPSQTRRLLAHLRLLIQAPASLAALKKKFEPLDQGVRETIAAFMATVAQSDGEVSPAEVKMLEKVYKALGVDAKKVFTDVHAVAAGVKPTAAVVAKVEETGFKLDPAKIAALQQDTERVSALLANIFTEAEAEDTVTSPADTQQESDGEADFEPGIAAAGLLGLDEAHSALARMMLSRPEWSREELLDVAADLDLMLDGALERINEAAFDAHDMPLCEGDEPVVVNAEILEKVEA